MRRFFSVSAIVLGVLLVVGAALIKWVAAPALIKAPLDIDRTTVATGRSQVFILAEQTVKTIDVTATRRVLGDKKAGTGSVAVYDETLCLAAPGAQNADANGCVSATDPAFIQKTTDRIAFDRKTALAVADGNRFGANVDGNKAIAHDGLGYTFPIDTKKKSYPFFDTVLGKAYPMQYASTEKVQGLTVYKFVQTVPSAAIKINGILPGTYSNTRTVWVEPTTGVIVKGAEQINQRFASGGVVFSGTITFDDATVKSQASFAMDQLNQVRAVRTYVPIGAAVLGVVLIIGGLILGRRRSDPRRAAAEDEPTA